MKASWSFEKSLIFNLKGETVSQAIYNCCWYNIDYQEIKDLTLILNKAQDPLTMNGGKLFELSYTSFLQVDNSNILSLRKFLLIFIDFNDIKNTQVY